MFRHQSTLFLTAEVQFFNDTRLCDFIRRTGDDVFSPNDPITREQMATIIKRYAEYRKCILTTESSAIDIFSDKDEISDWAVDAVKWAVSNGIIAGADRKIMPRANTTRAQTAAMIRSMLYAFDGGTFTERFTLAAVKRIIRNMVTIRPDAANDKTFSDILDYIRSRQLPDYVGSGNGVTNVEFWLDSEGKEKIMMILEKGEIYYLAAGKDSERLFPLDK